MTYSRLVYLDGKIIIINLASMYHPFFCFYSFQMITTYTFFEMCETIVDRFHTIKIQHSILVSFLTCIANEALKTDI